MSGDSLHSEHEHSQRQRVSCSTSAHDLATDGGAYLERLNMNVKLRSTALALVLALSVLPHSVTAQSLPALRIGIIDSRVLMQEMPGRSSAESQFALELAKARELVHAATDSLKASVVDLSNAEAELRPQQREAAVMVIRARELALEDMVAQLNGLAQRRMDELQAPLRERLRVAVKAVRVREKLSLVIDLAASGAIVDADEALNIMPQVLAELRRASR
jgi:Skp family chaperone for outer membrane proteins